jgi:hypothetical protein
MLTTKKDVTPKQRIGTIEIIVITIARDLKPHITDLR